MTWGKSCEWQWRSLFRNGVELPPPLNMWWVVLRLHVHRSMINIPASHLYLFSLSALTFTMITLPCSGRLWRNVLLKGTRCTICVQRGEKGSRSFLIMMTSSLWSCYSCCCYSNIVSLFTSQQHCFNFSASFCCYFSNVAIIEFHNRNIGWWSNWNQPALMWPISRFIKYGRMWVGHHAKFDGDLLTLKEALILKEPEVRRSPQWLVSFTFTFPDFSTLLFVPQWYSSQQSRCFYIRQHRSIYVDIHQPN